MTLIRPRNYRPPGTARDPGIATRNLAQTAAQEYDPPKRDAAGAEHAFTKIPAATAARSPETTEESARPATPFQAEIPASASDSAAFVAQWQQAQLQQALGDRYEVLKLIAVGGMADIFQLRHKLNRGMFVAKLMHAPLTKHPELVAAFHREAAHVAEMGCHPNVVPVFDLLLVGGVPCMLMPYIEGEDLDRLLVRAGRMERDQALMLLAQMTSLLMWAETLGILHCDLAPGNIRLDFFGHYRVLDFGLSRKVSCGTPVAEDSFPAAGTPAYNSPEQIRGDVLDHRTDLYAAGVIFFEALTGRPMFEAPSLEALSGKHLRGDWQLPTEIEADRPLAALIRSLVTVDRATRMQSAFELAGAIAALGFELPSFSRPLDRASALPSPKLRRRRLEAV